MIKKKAFTLIELLVVIAIIGLLATIAVIALNNARAKGRDVKRVADIKQVQTALELFFNDKGRYPTETEFNSGSIFSTSTNGTTTYMSIIPGVPTPSDGGCQTADNSYFYKSIGNGNSYTIAYCLGNTTGTLTGGKHCATPAGIDDGNGCLSAQNVNAKIFFLSNSQFVSTNRDSNGSPYLVYQDLSSRKATVMKYDGSNWVNVGSPEFSAGAADHPSIFIYNNTPYVVYEDEAYLNKATVMKYDGSNWVNVGDPGFSSDLSQFTTIFVYNGTPYVAFRDLGSGGKATVMKYDGSNWVNVGDPGFSPGNASEVSLYVYNGTPYVAFQYDQHNYRSTVMKYDGSNWVNVGSPDFSSDQATYLSLFIANGDPYVAYRDADLKPAVMKYDGSNWVNIGTLGFPDGAANYISLYIRNSTIYLAYFKSSENRIVLQKFNGTSWDYVDIDGLADGSPSYISLTLDSNGIPYIVWTLASYQS